MKIKQKKDIILYKKILKEVENLIHKEYKEYIKGIIHFCNRIKILITKRV